MTAPRTTATPSLPVAQRAIVMLAESIGWVNAAIAGQVLHAYRLAPCPARGNARCCGPSLDDGIEVLSRLVRAGVLRRQPVRGLAMRYVLTTSMRAALACRA